MQSDRNQKPVSHSHTTRAPIPKPTATVHSAQSVTIKKSQLQEAIQDFSAQEETTVRPKESLLSDSDHVLHVGKEAKGTIITDTKKHWSFSGSVKGALENWYGSKKQKIKETIAKPKPKKVVASSQTRTETIKKAAAKSNLAKVDSYKSVKPKHPITKRPHAQSSIRIKEKNIKEEIGETKPHWTHVVENKTPAPAPVQQKPISSATQKPDVTPTKTHLPEPDELLESPRHGRRLLASPEERRPANVQKTYRPVRTKPVVIKTVTPTESTTSDPVVPKDVTPEIRAPKPIEEVRTVPETIAAKPEPEPAPTVETTPTPQPKVYTPTPQPEPTPIVNRTPVTQNQPEAPALPIVTIVLVIIFIVALALSTTLLQSL